MTDARPGRTFVCTRCAADAPVEPDQLWCDACAGPLRSEVRGRRLDESALRGLGVWRYRDWLGVETPVTLAEPTTPLLRATWSGVDVTFKFEGSLPTGSFKDRGAAVLVSWLAEQGVERVADDSSGNAGAALAAYSARAGIACEVYVPADAPRAKLAQIEAYGARLVRVPGPRSAAADAVRTAREAVYASHTWSPLVVAGTQTFAFELWEQLGRRAPDVVVLPVGGGSLLLGIYEGFVRLQRAGFVERLPRIIGAQAAACAPLALAAAAGTLEPATVEPRPSAAGGIMLARPVRGVEVLAAVRATSGTVVAVEEADLLAAHRALARSGVFVEPTSAVAVAAVDAAVGRGLVERGEEVVVALTGHGLKAPPDLG